MANLSLFNTRPAAASVLRPPLADTRNEAGGLAYAFSPEAALAQYAVTGCFGHTFYADAEQQLDRVLALTGQVPPRFVAQTAVYAREHGAMKDVPALLVAALTTRADLVILFSDNESWMDSPLHGRTAGSSATETMRQWTTFRRRNPAARLVCMDLQPVATTQASERSDILNVGGFSDSVFELIARFANGELEAGHWVAQIGAVEI